MVAAEPPRYLRYDGVLMSGEDALAADFDSSFFGRVFLVATDERVDGEVVYARLDPKHVGPA